MGDRSPSVAGQCTESLNSAPRWRFRERGPDKNNNSGRFACESSGQMRTQRYHGHNANVTSWLISQLSYIYSVKWRALFFWFRCQRKYHNNNANRRPRNLTLSSLSWNYCHLMGKKRTIVVLRWFQDVIGVHVDLSVQNDSGTWIDRVLFACFSIAWKPIGQHTSRHVLCTAGSTFCRCMPASSTCARQSISSRVWETLLRRE